MAALSEAKQIEYDRRKDAMWSIAPLAAQLEIEWRNKKALQDRCIAKTKSKWLLLFFMLSLILHWSIPESEMGLILGIICASVFLGATMDERAHQDQLFHISHQLSGLNCKWGAVSGVADLGEIRRFIANDCFDDENEDYRKWMNHKLQYVLDEINQVSFSQKLDRILHTE